MVRSCNFDFTDMGVLVTGGAQGIGLKIVEDFLSAGARVVAWDVDDEALHDCKSRLSDFADRLHLQKVDVRSFDQCIEAARKLPWLIDTLINNAGVTRDKSFGKMAMDDFTAVIEVNLNGAVFVTKALENHFLQNECPKAIIYISSVVGIYGNFGQTNYAASKAGLIGFTKSLAKEWGRKGVRVNAVAPGFIQTEMVRSIPANVKSRMQSASPLGVMGEVQDISEACLFLTSESARFIHGAVLSVDGGLTI